VPPSRRTLVVIALAGSLLTGCSSSLSVAAATGTVGKAAPNFTLADIKGTPVHLSDYKGKVVLLNFWATWCGPCKIEIPWFIEFEKIYKDRGFATLGISLDDDGRKSVKPFVALKAMSYAVMAGDDQVSELFGGIDSLPTTFLIDREGKIVSTRLGLVSKRDYEAEILKLIAQ
jgi:peroxiredoxin